MIPLHRPAFGIGTVLTASLAGRGGRTVQQLEAAYAEATGCAYAVWLPSARAGIGWALRAAVGKETQIIGPAFTCGVVHEAMARSGGQVHLVDATKGDFLLASESIAPLQCGNHAVVLCEVYGHTYDLPKVASASRSSPVVRIVDMAMAVPHRALVQRLQPRDFAVISFGDGKSMYAGWGAMAFTPNATLANEVRNSRDANCSRGDLRLLLGRIVAATLRVVGSQPSIYAFAKWVKDQKPYCPAATSAPANKALPAALSEKQPQWQLPSTRLDRGLAMWNLNHAGAFQKVRLALATQYSKRLAAVPNLVCPKQVDDAISHFTVRIHSEIRDELKLRLYRMGINAITLWGFPLYLDRNQFPNAHRLSLEVLNLPLSPWMSLQQVDFVCEQLIHCVRTCSETKHTNEQS